MKVSEDLASEYVVNTPNPTRKKGSRLVGDQKSLGRTCACIEISKIVYEVVMLIGRTDLSV